MTRWAVLLRGVNVGGARRLPMAELRAALAAQGLADVVTHLQSGNAVLGGPDDEDEVVSRARRAASAAAGTDVEVVARSAAALEALLAANPWPERTAAPTQLHVAFLDRPPAPGTEARRVGEREEVRVLGREAWVWYGDGAGRSRLSLDGLGVLWTARNWRTVTALAELASA